MCWQIGSCGVDDKISLVFGKMLIQTEDEIRDQACFLASLPGRAVEDTIFARISNIAYRINNFA